LLLRCGARAYSYAVLGIIVLVAGYGWTQTGTQGHRVPAAVIKRSATVPASISVSFVELPDGAQLMGGRRGHGELVMPPVAYGMGAPKAGVRVERRTSSFIVSSRFGLRVDGPSGASGSAVVSAFLLTPDPYCMYFLDGIKLSMTPQVVAARSRFGAVTEHRLDVEVPVNMTVGAAANNIGFTAVPN